MIHALQPYPEYVSTDVAWLGAVPSHWQVFPNRALFREVIERDHPDEPMLSVTITRGIIRQASLLADSSKKDGSKLDKTAYKLVRPGDLAYNKMRAWQGAIGVSEHRGIVSPAYVVQRPREGSTPRYFHYLLRTPAFAAEAERWSYGITSDMWSLRPEHFRMIYGCLPPLSEQAAIVRFLDHADRRIRRYIAAKQKLIKLLEEQKQALIHQAVTRGLDPNARLKPSGVGWLGDVPEHWEVQKLGRVARVFNGTTPSRMQPRYWHAGTVPWVASGKVNDYIVEAPTEWITQEAFQASSLRLVPRGSVILGLVGQGKTRGMSAYLAIDTCINQNLAALVPSHGIRGRFLHSLLTAHYSEIRESGRGGNQEALNCEIVSSLRLPFPPLPEQDQIIRELDADLQRLEVLEQCAQREITLLREYRSRLIADVVTGKLDVRYAAARLPDEEAETDAGDEITVEGEQDLADEEDGEEGEE